MPDYKKLYFALFRANAAAATLLAQAQREAEAAILEVEDCPKLTLWQGKSGEQVAHDPAQE